MLSIIRRLAARREQSAGAAATGLPQAATGLPQQVRLVWTVRHKSEFTILDQAVLAAAGWVASYWVCSIVDLCSMLAAEIQGLACTGLCVKASPACWPHSKVLHAACCVVAAGPVMGG